MTTTADLHRALEAHVECLERCGITYEGRLGLDEGSKTYGRAFRLYRTGFPSRCQNRKNTDVMGNGGYVPVKNWDHADCDQCRGTGLEITSGHYPPPVGDDFLGMTKSEAYETLTARTRAIYDTVTALERR